MNKINDILELVKSSNNILIASHENPDEDALGSTIALGLSLESIGKHVHLYNESGVPDVLKFLPGTERILSNFDNIPDPEIVFILDCTEPGRVGKRFREYINSLSKVDIIVIDHHFTNQNNGRLSIVDNKASSTGFIVYQFLKNNLKSDINIDIAKNIYATIIGDTGSFSYSNTTPQSLRLAADLIEMGVDPYEISSGLYENEPLKKIKLIGLVLNTLELYNEGKIAFVEVTKQMLEETSTGKQHTEGIVNFPRSIKGVEIAVLIREDKPGLWKISLRSKGNVNVALIAEKFNGGGHVGAAGCNISGTVDTVKARLIQEIGGVL